MRRLATIIVALGLSIAAGCADAAAWGCDGHRAVVLIAERLLPPPTLAAAKAVLKTSPVDAAVSRFCSPVPDDPLVDDATWADDVRTVDPATAGWHFINLPRQAALTTSNERTYCPHGNCIVDALAAQYRVLTTAADGAARANALRYLLHFVGDLHQPLHTTTNGDRGGNCVPVTYLDRPPQESPTVAADYSPNLHSVWDGSMIRTLMSARRLADARALGDYIVSQHALPSAVAAKAVTRAVATQWASASHEKARTVAYQRLPVEVGLEPASALTLASCADNHDVARRMLAKHIVIDAAYEQAAVPAILDQLRIAGIRLAAALEAAFPARPRSADRVN